MKTDRHLSAVCLVLALVGLVGCGTDRWQGRWQPVAGTPPHAGIPQQLYIESREGMFRVSVTLSGTERRGVGLAQDGVLVCGWALKTAPGVSVHRWAGGGRWQGEWTVDNEEGATATETYQGPATPQALGVYDWSGSDLDQETTFRGTLTMAPGHDSLHRRMTWQSPLGTYMGHAYVASARLCAVWALAGAVPDTTLWMARCTYTGPGVAEMVFTTHDTLLRQLWRRLGP